MSQTSSIPSGGVAVVTGAASGIGLAAAHKLAGLGFKVALVDVPGDKLDAAATSVADGGATAFAFPCEVGDLEQVEALESSVRSQLGEVTILLNNAGIQPGSSIQSAANWSRIMQVNLWGIIYGCQTFLPGMRAHGKQAIIINTGSKQGITTPPGDPAYNVAKAGVKAFSEALQHDLRSAQNGRITAHLLIPGFVFTSLTANGRTQKPDAAWTPEQTVDFMIKSLDRGDFYILCPDNDVPRQLDEKRIAWAAGDIINNRPPLSRWHKDYAEAFADFLKPS